MNGNLINPFLAFCNFRGHLKEAEAVHGHCMAAEGFSNIHQITRYLC